MTKLTFNLIDNSTNKVLASNIPTYPQAKEMAEDSPFDCSIKSVYTSFEIKDVTHAKDRLLARV